MRRSTQRDAAGIPTSHLHGISLLGPVCMESRGACTPRYAADRGQSGHRARVHSMSNATYHARLPGATIRKRPIVEDCCFRLDSGGQVSIPAPQTFA
jgi:hypothetical protein